MVEYTEDEVRHRKTRKSLMVVGMIGMVMLFAGLTSAYIVRQADANWLVFDLPTPFFTSTALIILSSAFLFFAQFSIKKGQVRNAAIGLLATLGLGIGFVFAQFYTYGYMVDQGYYFVGTNVSASFMYILTAVHLAHLFGGLIALLVSTIKAFRNRYDEKNSLGLELTAMYWHFLGLLWIYLLLFLLFIR